MANEDRYKHCGQEGVCINAYDGPPSYWCSVCGAVGPMDDDSWDEPANKARLDAAERVCNAARFGHDLFMDEGRLDTALAAYDALVREQDGGKVEK